MRKLVLTGRTVKLSKEQQDRLLATGYESLRRLSKDTATPISTLIARLCSPDRQGAFLPQVLILESQKDLRKGPDGKNEALQMINASQGNVTIYRSTKQGMLRIKKSGEAMSILDLFNKLPAVTGIVNQFGICLLRAKWLYPAYENYAPKTGKDVDYAAEMSRAYRNALYLMREHKLNELHVIADRYTDQLKTLFWMAERTGTTVHLTWHSFSSMREMVTKAVWEPPMEFGAFLACIPDLNVYRYDTQDESGLRVRRWSRPRPFYIDPNPVDHSDDDPESFEERMEAQGIDPNSIVSYEQLQEKGYDTDDSTTLSKAGINRIRRYLSGDSSLVPVVVDKTSYAPRVACTEKLKTRSERLDQIASQPSSKPLFNTERKCITWGKDIGWKS